MHACVGDFAGGGSIFENVHHFPQKGNWREEILR